MNLLASCSRSAIVAVLMASAVSVNFGCQSDSKSVMKEPQFEVEGTLDFLRPDGTPFLRIAIELAESIEEQMTGLMGRRSLPSKGGMLFVYDSEIEQSFWMKSTPLPLDIIFIAADSSIVNIARRTTPLSEETITSTRPAQFVLELRAGFVDSHGIDESTRIKWKRSVTG